MKRSNFVEDCFDLEKRAGFEPKSRSGGDLLDTYKAGTDGFLASQHQVDKLVNTFKLERVTDPNDLDIKNTTAACSQFARWFSQSKPDVLAYKLKGRPSQLKLSSGRSFEFIILFYNKTTQEALMELGYEPITNVERNASAPQDILKKAEGGDAEAQYQLGKFYGERNNNFEAYNPKTAAAWYEKAAKQGHKDAQYQLSFIQGQLGGTDDAQSQKWLKLAAKQGQPDARYNLALSLLQKRGDENAKQEAKQILLKLADENNTNAMRCLAQYGVEAGREAYWYERAANAFTDPSLHYRWWQRIL
jgi:TPR repeat protein